MRKPKSSKGAVRLVNRTAPWALLFMVGMLVSCGRVVLQGERAVAAVYELAPSAVAQEQIDRDAAIFSWAVEIGVAQHFTLEDLEQVSSPYGVRTSTQWEKYEDYRDQVTQQVRSAVRNALSLEDVRAYYQENLQVFAQQDPIELEVSEWEDGRVVSKRSVSIDETTVRMAQEQDDEVISPALQLEPGQEITVQRAPGQFAIVKCLSRGDGGYKAFDEVVQAASSQLSSSLFELELQARIATTP